MLYRRAREHGSPALEGDAAHLRADALTSFGVLVGLGLVEITGEPAFDAIAALAVAGAIVWSGRPDPDPLLRVLVDEAPPPEELDRIEAAIAAPRHARDGRLPQAPRAARAGASLHIDLHVQFRTGTTLERAHELAHALRGAIERDTAADRRPDPRRARGLGARARGGRALQARLKSRKSDESARKAPESKIGS